MGDVEPKRPISRVLFIVYIFQMMGLMLTLAGALLGVDVERVVLPSGPPLVESVSAAGHLRACSRAAPAPRAAC